MISRQFRLRITFVDGKILDADKIEAQKGSDVILVYKKEWLGCSSFHPSLIATIKVVSVYE